jgi:hypothetical protein
MSEGIETLQARVDGMHYDQTFITATCSAIV